MRKLDSEVLVMLKLLKLHCSYFREADKAASSMDLRQAQSTRGQPAEEAQQPWTRAQCLDSLDQEVLQVTSKRFTCLGQKTKPEFQWQASSGGLGTVFTKHLSPHALLSLRPHVCN